MNIVYEKEKPGHNGTALRGQKQENHEFEIILGYIASLRPAWATR